MDENLLALLLLIIWIVSALYFSFRKKLFSRFEEGQTTKISGLRVLFAFIIFIFVQSASIHLALLFVKFQYPKKEAYTLATDIGIFLSTMALVSLTLKERVKHLIWGRVNPFIKLLKGASWWFIAYPIAIAISALVMLFLELFIEFTPTPQIAVEFLQSLKDDTLLLVLNGFILVVLTPISEEILFRGFLYNFLKRIFPMKGSLILSSVVFAFFHFDTIQGYSNFSFLVALTTLGMFLAWIYEREGSLWAPIGLHAFFNFVTVLSIIFVN